MELPVWLKWVRLPLDRVIALRDLPAMRRDIADLKRTGGDPLRCSMCGARLTVTASSDIPAAFGGALWGERLDLRCDTPGCGFTPRTRDVQYRD